MSDDQSASSFWKGLFGKLLLVVIIGGPLLFAGWAWISLKFVYSSGDRAGYLQKLSKKGWICKTWEGELAMVNLPGAMAEKFQFTVRDEKVAEEMAKALGQRVSVAYEYHVGVPTTCFGETQFYITKFHAIPDAGAQQTTPTPAPPAAK